MKQFVLLLLPLLFAGCAATQPLHVQQVEFRQTIWTDSQRRAGILFQDGAQAVSVAGGTIWTFGDTFIGKPQPGQAPQNSQISGSRWMTLAFLPSGSTNLPPALEYITESNGVAACPLELFPDEDHKHLRMWPLDGVSLGDRVYFYYTMVETTDAPGPWNFHGVGSGLAVADKTMQHAERLRPGGHWQFPVTPAQIIHKNKWLYLFEVSGDPKGLILARVKTEKIADPQAYEFFNDGKWSSKRTDAKVILNEVYGQVSIVWQPALKRYVMATSSDFSHPNEIQLRQAKALTGPWSAPVRITVPAVPGRKTKLVYCTFFHPELSGGDPQTLVATFCRIYAGSWELCNPELVVITLSSATSTQ
ncbi:MAG TPA: DUF4185 domain-containing protein [Verrucomicrobiae bacterium]|jgi:hypothetical protein